MRPQHDKEKDKVQQCCFQKVVKCKKKLNLMMCKTLKLEDKFDKDNYELEKSCVVSCLPLCSAGRLV